MMMMMMIIIIIIIIIIITTTIIYSHPLSGDDRCRRATESVGPPFPGNQKILPLFTVLSLFSHFC